MLSETVVESTRVLYNVLGRLDDKKKTYIIIDTVLRVIDTFWL